MRSRPAVKRVILAAALAALPLFSSAMSWGQETRPATGPADAAVAGGNGEAIAPDGEFSGTITGVEGRVRVRLAEDQPWQPAQVGMALGAGAEFQTGPRSAVRVQLPAGQVITLDRLGTMRLLEAARSQGKVKTDLGMKYGRVRYDIEAAGEQYDAKIHTPGSTLAVRGTQVNITNDGFYPTTFVSLKGKAWVDDNGVLYTLGGPEAGAVIVSGAGSAAETALLNTYSDPSVSHARTAEEQQAILTTPMTSGFTFGNLSSGAGLRSLDGGTLVQPELVTGSLLFQLVWIHSSASSATPDIDLFVRSPLGELLGPKGGLSISPSGGRTLGDDRGGRSFVAGQEIVAWGNSFPVGQYTFGLQHVSGASAEYQIVVLRDGELVREPVVGTVDVNDRDQFTVNVTRGTFTPIDDDETASARRRSASLSKSSTKAKVATARVTKAKVATVMKGSNGR